MPIEDVVAIVLHGTLLDVVGDNIVASIGGIERIENASLNEQFQDKIQKEKFLKQLASLKKQCKVES